MKKLSSSLKNMLLSLTGIAILASLSLSVVHQVTAGPIEKAQTEKLNNAIKEVTPAFNNNPKSESFKVFIPSVADSLIVYPAKKDGKLVGLAIGSFSTKGFAGLIKVLVGFNDKGDVYNYAILKQAETPGLGTKIVFWFKDKQKPNQNVIGRDLSKGPLSVSKDGGQIDAITASTISSRAFLGAVNLAYEAYVAAMKNMNVNSK